MLHLVGQLLVYSIVLGYLLKHLGNGLKLRLFFAVAYLCGVWIPV